MTSDARIGLLLGSVIILVIAFIINGPPFVPKPTDSRKPNTIIADRPLGIVPEVSPEVFLLKRVSEQPPEEAPPHIEDNRKAKQRGQYVVQKDDSLWRIATEQLGDGSRYKEISKLNADILEDEDHLSIGMYLTMPVR